MDREQAIENCLKERKEEAERAFQAQVKLALAAVTKYAEGLKFAKKSLMALEYKEPQELDLE